MRIPAWPSPAALLLAAVACAAPPSGRYPVSAEATLLELPIVRQDRMHSCGLAAVSALCAFYGRELPEAEQERWAELAEREQGLSGAQVRELLESRGLATHLYSAALAGGPNDAVAQLDAGRPLLVMISHDQGQTFHYCLLVGHDPTLDTVHLLDPRRGLVLLPSERFDRLWAVAERFTLLALPVADL